MLDQNELECLALRVRWQDNETYRGKSLCQACLLDGKGSHLNPRRSTGIWAGQASVGEQAQTRPMRGMRKIESNDNAASKLGQRHKA